MQTIYKVLSGLPLVGKSYTYKFLFVAFLGIHIPLIGLILFLIFSPNTLSPGHLFFITLGLTLAATAATLFILKKLLMPLQASRKALEQYRDHRQLPALPMQYPDEAGSLMRELQLTVEMLDQLLQEKRDLVGLLSHDLRMPLATISLISKQLERQPRMDDEQRRYLSAMITDSAAEQTRLFNRILDLLRHDEAWTAGSLKLEEVDVQEIIEKAVGEVETLASQKELRIRQVSAERCLVKVDPVLMSQVIKNLLSNAIKFSHHGNEVSIGHVSSLAGCSIQVQDQGLGFSLEEAPGLFDRFTQSRKSGTANEVSVGMGLYLSKKIVVAHRGELRASSAGHNQGATFTIEL